MIPLSKIEWGPADAAEPDDSFLDKFIEPEDIKKLLEPKYWIITGEKGSGKTALCKGLILKHGSEFAAIRELLFKDVEFAAIIKNLIHLSKTTDISSLSLISNYWEYVIIIEAMKASIANSKLHLSKEATLLHNYLTKHGLIENTVTSTMLSLIGSCWNFIDEWTKPGGKKPNKILLPSNLAPQVVDQISKYPIFDPEFKKARNIFSTYLRDKKEKVLITLDGFDRLKTSQDTNRLELQIIFEGLIEAVYAISISTDFYDCIQIKALVPYDRYISLELRDMDKFESKYRNIRWDYNSLQEFLAKRLSCHHNLQHVKTFTDLWGEVMPQKIHNSFYDIPEDTYDYILRHTMYRPRHFQIHLQMLSEMYPNKTIDPSMISKAIRESSKKIADFFMKEYKIDHPLIEPFLKRFKGKPNIMEFKEFRAIVGNALEALAVKDWDIDQKINTLYNIGFCGVVKLLGPFDGQIQRIHRYHPPRKIGIAPYRCDFYYTKPIPKLSSYVDNDSLIAIHPLFFDYCDMTPDTTMLIG
jgi:hypothetical protein